jgi:hypothetical protein
MRRSCVPLPAVRRRGAQKDAHPVRAGGRGDERDGSCRGSKEGPGRCRACFREPRAHLFGENRQVCRTACCVYQKAAPSRIPPERPGRGTREHAHPPPVGERPQHEFEVQLRHRVRIRRSCGKRSVHAVHAGNLAQPALRNDACHDARQAWNAAALLYRRNPRQRQPRQRRCLSSGRSSRRSLSQPGNGTRSIEAPQRGQVRMAWLRTEDGHGWPHHAAWTT